MAYDSPPSDNLYMKGLPAGTTEETLKAIFGVYGTVISCKVLATPAGVSDAAALVRMGSIAEAQYLVENAVNIASGLGSPVQIRFANSKGAGKGQQVQAAPAAIGAPLAVPSNRLYMKGLPAGMTEDQLRSVMGAYGQIVSLKILPTPPAGAPDTAAIVQMGTEQEAHWLVENLDGNIPQGLSTPVQIKYKSDGYGGVASTPVPQQHHVAPIGAPYVVPGQAWAETGFGGAGLPEDHRGSVPSDNLYMRGLPPGATEETITAIFGVYGTVASCRILPPPPGKTDVACLVRMGTIEEATWLVDNLNGNIPQGLSDPINIRFADNAKGNGKGLKGKESEGSWAPYGGGGAWPSNKSPAPPTPTYTSGGPDIPSTNLYMKGLPNDTTEASIRHIFGAYGNVVSVKVLACPPGVNSAAALVQMGELHEAEWLVANVNNNIPEGLTVPIQIKFANNSKGAGKGGAGPPGGTWAPPPGPPAITWHPSGGAGAPPAAAISDNLYMKGFPADVDEMMLRAILGPYGNIVSCKVLPPPPGKSCAAALVRMATTDEAKWLVDNMNGNIPEGQSAPVEVKYAANAGGCTGKGAPRGDARYSPY